MLITFGSFTLDDEQRRLIGDGRDVHLSLKAFELLRILLEARPRALSKRDLYERLWPDTIVSDASLTTLVGELRAALGDTAGQARFIRTVHRYGYAFAGVAHDTRQATVAPPSCCWLIWGERRLPLHEGENVMGRDPAADVWLASLSISRRHARVVITGTTATIEDLGSKNGTFVGAAPVTKQTELAEGDEIRCGTLTLVFRSLALGASTQTVRR